MKKLKTVVCGIGRIGWQYHMPFMLKHGGFELVAAADPLAERRAEVEKEFGLRAYEDPIAMFETEKPDLAVLASPSHVHCGQAIAAMERGIDIFTDKPMAVNLAEGMRMAEAAKRTGRKLMVFQPAREERDALAVKSILSGGLLGDVYLIRAYNAGYARRNDWQALRKYGGGTLNNAGSHMIDCMLHLSGSRAASVSCQMKRIASLGDAEDVVKAMIKAESGMLLEFEINFAAAVGCEARWAVYGNRGAAVLRDEEDGYGWFELTYVGPEGFPEKSMNPGTAAPDRKYMRESIQWQTAQVRLDAFQPTDYYHYCYDYFALGKPPYVPVEQSLEALRVIEECRKADGNFPILTV